MPIKRKNNSWERARNAEERSESIPQESEDAAIAGRFLKRRHPH
jgi:hypothetical protein